MFVCITLYCARNTCKAKILQCLTTSLYCSRNTCKAKILQCLTVQLCTVPETLVKLKYYNV